ncbi:MAG: o-succinylbenzoate synthase, partial [Actinobacteria bacterium]|nr:o-succinylbenzoate synthase [Actinomycetota bacterium]
ETGIGRAANLALAALPGFTLPGDTSASNRYYLRDITTPFVMVDGRIRVPKGPGIGVEIDHAFLESVTLSKRTI